jgi:hypothetical protein
VARIQAERLGAHATLVTALGGGVVDASNDPSAKGPTQAEQLPAHGKKTRSVPLMPAALLAPKSGGENADSADSTAGAATSATPAATPAN